MWLQRFLLCAIAAKLLAWECGVTPEWERQLEAQVDDARRLLSGTAFARSTTLGPFRIYAHYLDMSALQAQTVTRIKEITMPSVLKWFANVLSVKNLSENWKLSQTTCGSAGTVPTAHTTTGIPNVDLVVYVFASTDSAGTWAARAGACAFDGGSSMGAPIAGTFEFNAAKYTASLDTEVEIGLCRHEITHILAVAGSLFARYRQADGTAYTNPTNTVTVRDKTVSQLATPLVLTKTKASFGCSTLTGLELEDSGGSGTAGSHWDKRIMLNDYMTGSTGADPIYSDITLAAFEDSGWYNINYDYTDQIVFGRNRGCTFFTTKCVTNGVANFPEFCATTGQTCANQNTRKGYCNISTYTSALPAINQYFTDPMQGGSDSLADYCPYISPYSNGDCTGRSKTSTSTGNLFGEQVCETCRCFSGTYIIHGYTLNSGNPNHLGCHAVSCTGGVATVTIGTTTVTCPTAGGQVSTITGYDGFINCPAYADICGPKVCPNGCYGYGKCVSGLCVCNEGYSGSNCSTICDATCKTCSGTSTTQCVTCYANATQTSGSCVCNSGYSLDSITKRCVASSYTCDITCLTCTGPEATKCSTCVANATISSTGACVCSSGFTRSAGQTQCVACHATCTTCVGIASDNCSACKTNAALPSGQTQGLCTCNTGFYMKSDSTCAACHTTCKTCTAELITSCSSCKTADANVTDGACVCNNGFFLSVDGSQCVACNSTCKTCIGASASQCKSCFNLGVLTPTAGPGTCGCASGYFYSAPTGCQACHFSCKTCSGAASTQCTSCQNGNPNSTGECLCDSSSFMNSSGVCSPCSQNCATCVDSDTKCTSCDTTVSALSTDTCTCLSTAFLSATNKCTPCHPTCLTCNLDTATSCSTCGSNAAKVSGACNCNPGFTRSTDFKSCIACHPSCATCSGTTASNCVTCKDNATAADGVCKCNAGYYMKSDNTCAACNPLCATCSGSSATECLSCKLTAASVVGGTCVCQGHTYITADGAQCLECDVSCKTCNATSESACLACYNLGILTPVSGPGTCSCRASLFYTPPDGCLGCHATCEQCTGVLASQCTSCYTGAALTGTSPSSCGCGDGYVISTMNGSCLPCAPNCKTCSGTASKCTTCDTSVSQLSNDFCLCLSSAFKSVSGACVACHSSCVTCSAASSKDCLSCSSNAVLSTSPGMCTCARGFFPNTDVKNCAACHSSCKECTGTTSTACSQCFSPATLSSTGSCSCPTGFYPSSDASNCKACDSTCKSCSAAGADKCMTCFAQAQLSGTAPNSCVCVSGTVPRPTTATCGVLNCDLTCQTCSDSGIEMCKSCYANAVGRSSTFPTACVCAVGFYPNPNSANCAACDTSCLTCIGATQFSCLTCPSGKVLVDSLYCGEACPTGQTAVNGVCVASAASAVFRLKLDQIVPTLNDTIAQAKVQLGNSPNPDTSDPSPFYQQGYFFDDDYILLPPTNAETTRNIVLRSTHGMEFWIRTTADAPTGCLASKYKTTSQALSLLLRFCVTDTSQLLLEVSGVSLADASVKVTKSLIGGQLTPGRVWTSVGYQLVLKSKTSTTVSLLVGQRSVTTDTYSGIFFRDFIGNVDSVKFVIGASFYSYQVFNNYFKGSIAEVTIYNSEVSLSVGTCGCSTCTTGSICLNQCFSNEYLATSGCGTCQSTCTSGCIRGTDCRTNIDPLCSSFTTFVGCNQCSDLAELTSTGCQCTANANYLATKGGCECADGYQKSGNKCVQCRVYFDTNMVSAYFDSSFMKIIIEFTKPVDTSVVSSCGQLFLSDTLTKLGSNPSCTWTTNKSVRVFLGTNSTIVNEKLFLNYISLYSSQGSCSFVAVPLEPIAAYKFALPTVVTKLITPQIFSVTCSPSNFLQLDSSGTTGGKGRDLTFTWAISSDPQLSTLSQYQSFKSTDSVLSIPKGLLSDSTLTVKVTAQNFYGSENSITSTIVVTSETAISLEIDGGSSITTVTSIKYTVKVNPKAICSKTSSLKYTWSFVEASPVLTNVNFPFLSSPSPPNTITIPANTLEPGYTYSFLVKASDGKSTGSTSFRISVPKSPLVAELDRTSCDISVSNTFQISGERSKDPDGLDGQLAYSWSCFEGTNSCTDPTGNAVVNSETKSTLTISPNKLKENSTWNITLTVSKDTRQASKSVSINIKAKTAADFTQLKAVAVRVNPQQNLKLVLGVSSALRTTFAWSQVFGNGLSLLTPLTYSYLLIAGGSMQSGATYGFSLTATNSNGQSSAQIFFTANYPPSSGTATVSPTSGIALSTIYQVVCSNWEDEEQDFPLSYSLTYTYRNYEVAVGTRSLSNIKLIKAGVGTYQLTAYVYDTIGSVTTVKLPVITATKPSRMLQSTDVLNAFLEDTVDTDRTYEMVLAYSSVYEFTNSTFSGIFAALQSYVSQVVNVDSTDLDSCISCLGALFDQKRQMNSANLQSLLFFIDKVIDRYEPALTDTQTAYLNAVLGRYPGTSDDERAQLKTFLSKLMQTSSAENLPDQTAATFSSDTMNSYMRRVSSATLGGLKVSSGNTAVSFPSDLLSNLGLSESDVLDVRTETVKYANNTSDQVEIGLYSSGRFVEYAFEPSTTQTEVSVKNLATPITFSLPVNNYKSNVTYECVYKDSTGSWSSAGVNLTAMTAKLVTCTSTHLSTFQAVERKVDPIPVFPATPTPDTTIVIESDSCNKNFAPIAIVCAVVLFGLILTFAMNSFDKHAKGRQSEEIRSSQQEFPSTTREFKGLEMLNEKNINAFSPREGSKEFSSNIPVLQVIPIVESSISSSVPVLRLLMESHCLLGLFVASPDLRKWNKVLILMTALSVEMVIVGSRYDRDQANDSHSLNEIWTQYDETDFVNALIGLAVGLGVSAILMALFTIVGKTSKMRRVLLATTVLLAIWFAGAAVAGSIYMDLDLCFEAGGRWAINFLVLVAGELLICQSLVSGVRTAVIKIVA